jgi:hypothetical protein
MRVILHYGTMAIGLSLSSGMAQAIDPTPTDPLIPAMPRFSQQDKAIKRLLPDRVPPPGLISPVTINFRAEKDCRPPDPKRAILSFRVTADPPGSRVIQRVRINALEGTVDAGRTRLIYEESAPPGKPWSEAADSGIRDPAPTPLTSRYVLVVYTTGGHIASRALEFRYPLPFSFRLSSKRVGEVRISSGYRYGNAGIGRNVARVLIVPACSGCESTWVEREWLPGAGLIESFGVEYDRSDRLSRGRDITFTYQAESIQASWDQGNEVCGIPTVIYDTAVLPRASKGTPSPPPAGEGTPPSGDSASSSLPDLVPVITLFDGSQLQFRVDNRGSAAVTSNFDLRYTAFPGKTNRTITVGTRIDAGGSWSSKRVSVGTSSGAGGMRIRAEVATVDVDIGDRIRERNEGNNGARAP